MQTRERQEEAPGPRYEEAQLGFRNYWYPAMFSKNLGKRPRPVTLLGDEVLLVRRHGTAYAVEDRCPHRLIPLRYGKNDFPDTSSIVCRYHGWVFDLSTGMCVAALTDGPESPVPGKTRVRTYPVEERKGIVWIWMGTLDPVPLEEDVPEGFFDENAVIEGWFRERPGNWRYAAENGFDSAHAKYLHRDSIWQLFNHPAAWDHSTVHPTDDKKWMTRNGSATSIQGEYPGLGVWPKIRWWRRLSLRRGRRSYNRMFPPGVSLRLPGLLRVNYYRRWTHFEWYVPVDADHYRYCQFAVAWGRGPRAWLHRLEYRLYVKWGFHWRFNGQDGAMVDELTKAERKFGANQPVRLFRPDVSVSAWRKMVEGTARGEVEVPAELGEEVPEVGAETLLKS